MSMMRICDFNLSICCSSVSIICLSHLFISTKSVQLRVIVHDLHFGVVVKNR
jgi:hypothetical protein